MSDRIEDVRLRSARRDHNGRATRRPKTLSATVARAIVEFVRRGHRPPHAARLAGLSADQWSQTQRVMSAGRLQRLKTEIESASASALTRMLRAAAATSSDPAAALRAVARRLERAS